MKRIALFILLIFVMGCNRMKTYTYIETTNVKSLTDTGYETTTRTFRIKALNDLQAYSMSYAKYFIRKKVADEAIETYGKAVTIPIRFDLQDDDKSDIIRSISSANRDSIEKVTEQKVVKLMKESNEKRKRMINQKSLI